MNESSLDMRGGLPPRNRPICEKCRTVLNWWTDPQGKRHYDNNNGIKMVCNKCQNKGDTNGTDDN